MNVMQKGTVLMAALLVALAGPAAAQTKKSKVTAKPVKKSAAKPAPSASGGRVLDNFSAIDWGQAKDAGAEIKLSQAAGKTGSALKINYNLGSGKWVAVNKAFAIEDFRGKALVFWMKGKGAENMLEVKLVDEDDTNYGFKRPVTTKQIVNQDDPNYDSKSKEGVWTQVTIGEPDFSYWWGGDQTLGRIRDVYLAISGQGGAGELTISDLRLGTANPAGHVGKDGLIADGESLDSWTVAKGDGASAALFQGAGIKGKALGLRYSLPANQWVAIRKTLNADLANGNPVLVLRIRGEGEPNNVEIKIVDRDESTFGKVFSGMGASNAWQEVKIPLSDLQYLWGGDNRLDASLVRYLDIAVSGSGGDGRILINDIRVVR